MEGKKIFNYHEKCGFNEKTKIIDRYGLWSMSSCHLIKDFFKKYKFISNGKNLYGINFILHHFDTNFNAVLKSNKNSLWSSLNENLWKKMNPIF